MHTDANRDEDEMDDYDADEYDGPDDFSDLTDANAYWRRRFIILACGIVALGLCVWLFPGGRPAPAHPSARVSASMAALARGGALPSAAYGTAWRGLTATPPPAASVSPSPAASHTAAAKTKAKTKEAKRTTQPKGSRSPAASASGGRRCAPADIVLSLFTSQASYVKGEMPSFSVYAVSTSATACTLAYGPGSLHIVVTSHGRVVWDSDTCKPSAAPRVRFTLGVPRVLTMWWNRKATSPPGCGGTLSAGASGRLRAVALAVGQTSAVRSFRLDR